MSTIPGYITRSWRSHESILLFMRKKSSTLFALEVGRNKPSHITCMEQTSHKPHSWLEICGSWGGGQIKQVPKQVAHFFSFSPVVVSYFCSHLHIENWAPEGIRKKKLQFLEKVWCILLYCDEDEPIGKKNAVFTCRLILLLSDDLLTQKSFYFKTSSHISMNTLLWLVTL